MYKYVTAAAVFLVCIFIGGRALEASEDSREQKNEEPSEIFSLLKKQLATVDLNARVRKTVASEGKTESKTLNINLSEEMKPSLKLRADNARIREYFDEQKETLKHVFSRKDELRDKTKLNRQEIVFWPEKKIHRLKTELQVDSWIYFSETIYQTEFDSEGRFLFYQTDYRTRILWGLIEYETRIKIEKINS